MKVVTNRSSIAAFVACLVLCCAIAFVAQASSLNQVSRPPCSDCHLCNSPTLKEPCLRSCMRPSSKANWDHKPEEGPGLIVLKGSSNVYDPVMFDHRSHAEMGSMGDGCVSCHHYAPAGHIPPCSDCHLKPSALGQPGLKGAYHRQCLGCHEEWSGSTDCVYCHPPKETGSTVGSASSHGQGRLIASTALKPDKRVYYTSYAKGEKVTFYHNEHADLFGLECTSCHQQESCGNCHDRSATVASKKTGEEIHAICMDCHQGDKCNKCHGDKEKPPFQHDPDHWSLGGYHRQLECASCHPTGKRISQMNADCNYCHDQWDSENFVHLVTGLKLDDIHVDLDCGDCHLDRRFHDSPDCTGCHDDGRTPQTNPPGTRMNLTALGGLTEEAEEAF